MVAEVLEAVLRWLGRAGKPASETLEAAARLFVLADIDLDDLEDQLRSALEAARTPGPCPRRHVPASQLLALSEHLSEEAGCYVLTDKGRAALEASR